jgi:hypothetical protein
MGRHKTGKCFAAVLLSLIMVLGGSISSFASAATISNVSLSFSYSLNEDMSESDVSVSCSSSHVEADVDDIYNVGSGKKPYVKILLSINDTDAYNFSSSASWSSKNRFSFSGDKVTFKSASRKNKGEVVLYVYLKKIDDDDDDDLNSGLEVSDLNWDEDSGSGDWTGASDADLYYVKLYRGSSTMIKSDSTSDTSYDFSSYITQTGNYYFKVRAKDEDDSTYGDWDESDTFYVSSSTLSDLKNGTSSSGGSSSTNGPGVTGSTTGAWLKDSSGWWYCNADRSYTTSNWQQINNYWYWFDSNGYMKTGWLQSPFSGKWYWLNTNEGYALGRMLTSQWVDSDKYYVGSDGAWEQNKTK